ncbi:MAG: hypothetical protein AVDCRST_MAG53-3417, partial [uncultured Solirubrobacteraceae bacterium]
AGRSRQLRPARAAAPRAGRQRGDRPKRSRAVRRGGGLRSDHALAGAAVGLRGDLERRAPRPSAGQGPAASPRAGGRSRRRGGPDHDLRRRSRAALAYRLAGHGPRAPTDRELLRRAGPGHGRRRRHGRAHDLSPL